MAIRTFNSAKKFAEDVLHPLISRHTDAKLTTRLGAKSNAEASLLPPNQRIIRRFNALKERIILQQTLINEIEATVRLNGVKCEIALIEELNKQLVVCEKDFDERSDEIITYELVRGSKKPYLTEMFSDLCRFLDSTYVHVQRLMTKNKLLFYSDDDEFLEDQELKEKIKISNRSS